MSIGRFDLFLTQPQPDSLDQFFHEQQQRIEAVPIPVHPRASRPDPGGAYTLEIRGVKPLQESLTETPYELAKRTGEVAFKGSIGAYLSGS